MNLDITFVTAEHSHALRASPAERGVQHHTTAALQAAALRVGSDEARHSCLH